MKQDEIAELKKQVSAMSSQMSELTVALKKAPVRDSELQFLSVMKTLKDQVSVMNGLTTELISKNNIDNARVEKKVDDISTRVELKLDELNTHLNSIVNNVMVLSAEMRNKAVEQDGKLENVESIVGHVSGDSCSLTVKKFCEEMQGKEVIIKELIQKEVAKAGAFGDIKKGFFTTVGGSILTIAMFIVILIMMGGLVMFNMKVADLQKSITPVIKTVTP